MRLLIVGAGSTGGRLAEAGRDVTFLVRPKRAAELQKTGLHVISPRGSISLQPRLVSAGNLTMSFDAILLTVKAFALVAALDDLAPAVGSDTMILPVLNGMKHVDQIVERFGRRVLIGCAAKLATTLDDEGRIVQLNSSAAIAYGEMDGELTTRMRDLDAYMQNAGFEARLSSSIQREMWEKWILLATLGSVTCLMRGNIGQIVSAPGGREFVLDLFNEVVTIVRAVEIAPSEQFLTNARTMLTASGSSLTSSMYRDLEKGAPVEVEQILTDLLRRGQQAGIASRLLAAANTNLSIYAQQVMAGRTATVDRR
jgi:2-dehydropantoate 2-reductase